MIMHEGMNSKVLVIDDEVGPRVSLRMLLKNDYDVILAESVDEGVKLLVEKSPDLVIMDIRMPRKTGIEGLKEIREIDSAISVVMLTGFGTLETAQQAMRLGANDYLKKPFDTKELRKVIELNIDRTRVERRRVHVAAELRTLNTELVDELTTKEHMATLGHASSEFMHDLRNPLTVVHGYSQLLSEQLDILKTKGGEDTEEALDYLNIISRNIERCYEITEMWRNPGNVEELCTDRVVLADVLHDIVKSSEPIAISAKATLEFDMRGDPGVLRGNSIQLFRALQNLVNNAIHALPSTGGVVRIETRTIDDRVNIEISDNGTGMSEDQLQKIFEPYFTTKGVGEGTGLGLAITKRVMETHDGTIAVESELGKGTRFVLSLPRENRPEEASSDA